MPTWRSAPAPLDVATAARLSRQPRAGTKPELSLRRSLHRRGMRFRANVSGLPGRPDIAFTRAKIAVFVDGCFWHRCPDHGTVPVNNREWWLAKLARNVARDRAKDAALTAMGWHVIHVWEHEPVEKAADRIQAAWRSRIDEIIAGPANSRRRRTASRDPGND